MKPSGILKLGKLKNPWFFEIFIDQSKVYQTVIERNQPGPHFFQILLRLAL